MKGEESHVRNCSAGARPWTLRSDNPATRLCFWCTLRSPSLPCCSPVAPAVIPPTSTPPHASFIGLDHPPGWTPRRRSALQGTQARAARLLPRHPRANAGRATLSPPVPCREPEGDIATLAPGARPTHCVPRPSCAAWWTGPASLWQRVVAAMRLVRRHWQRDVSGALPALATVARAGVAGLACFPNLKVASLAAPEHGVSAAGACLLLELLSCCITGLRRLSLASWDSPRPGLQAGWRLHTQGLAELQRLPHLSALSLEGPWGSMASPGSPSCSSS